MAVERQPAEEIVQYDNNKKEKEKKVILLSDLKVWSHRV